MGNATLRAMEIAEMLESFILDTVKGATKVEKYGGSLFTLKPDEKEGQFCGVFIYKQHAQVSLSKGALLEDAQNILQGSGKFRRHINYYSTESVDLKALKKLLVQAAAL